MEKKNLHILIINDHKNQDRAMEKGLILKKGVGGQLTWGEWDRFLVDPNHRLWAFYVIKDLLETLLPLRRKQSNNNVVCCYMLSIVCMICELFRFFSSSF